MFTIYMFTLDYYVYFMRFYSRLSLLCFKRSKTTSCHIFWNTLTSCTGHKVIQKCASGTFCSFCHQAKWTVRAIFSEVEQHQKRVSSIQHSAKYIASVAVSKTRHHWPLLVWGRAGAELYEFWRALGRRRTLTRASQWFQQDGATPHTANWTLLWER